MPRRPPGSTAADRVLQAVAQRPPTLGEGRLVCLDGPAGSGKTTLAADLAAARPGTATVHLDDLLQGWGGLVTVDVDLDALLRPLAAGRPGRHRRWDWHADRWGEVVTVPPAPLLVVEGAGSGALRCADLVTLLVWVQAPEGLRRQRALARDAGVFGPHWHRWADQEAQVFARDRVRERADLLLDGGSGTVLEPGGAAATGTGCLGWSDV